MTGDLKKGEQVRVVYERPDVGVLRTTGKFTEYIDIGLPGTMYAIVRLSKYGSVLVPTEKVERLS